MTTVKKVSETQDNALKFEDAMARLSAIVERLEAGEGSLDEMIRLYEEGMALVKGCEAQLNAYDAAITKLTDLPEDADVDA